MSDWLETDERMTKKKEKAYRIYVDAFSFSMVLLEKCGIRWIDPKTTKEWRQGITWN